MLLTLFVRGTRREGGLDTYEDTRGDARDEELEPLKSVIVAKVGLPMVWT